jgi:hypothetical protein
MELQQEPPQAKGPCSWLQQPPAWQQGEGGRVGPTDGTSSWGGSNKPGTAGRRSALNSKGPL